MSHPEFDLGAPIRALIKDSPRVAVLLRARALRQLARDLRRDKVGPLMAAKIIDDHADQIEREVRP